MSLFIILSVSSSGTSAEHPLLCESHRCKIFCPSPTWPVPLWFEFYVCWKLKVLPRSSKLYPVFCFTYKIQRNTNQMVCSYSLNLNCFIGNSNSFPELKKMLNLPNFFYISTKILITSFRVTLLHFTLLATQLVKKMSMNPESLGIWQPYLTKTKSCSI